MRMVFLGPPGAGKGTQAQQIHEETSIPLLIMGDMLRASVKRQDEVGLEAQGYMNRGELVPDEVVIRVILKRLEEEDCQTKGFMLDGFPRTSQQAQALDKHLSQCNQQLDLVIYYSLPDEIAIQRLSGRKICRKCGKIYNISTLNISTDEQTVCSKENCGGEIYQRVDDDPSVQPKRLAEYHQKTSPLLEYYRQKGMLREVSANRKVEEIFSETMKNLKMT